MRLGLSANWLFGITSGALVIAAAVAVAVGSWGAVAAFVILGVLLAGLVLYRAMNEEEIEESTPPGGRSY